MEAVRIETKVLHNGRVVIEDLPFEEGEQVEVIVLEQGGAKTNTGKDRYPLRGTSYEYEDPFSPLVSPEELEPLA